VGQVARERICDNEADGLGGLSWREQASVRERWRESRRVVAGLGRAALVAAVVALALTTTGALQPGSRPPRRAPALRLAVYPGGGVAAFGDAANVDPPPKSAYDAPVVGIATDPGHQGYWVVSASGQVRSFGGVPNFGSIGRRTEAPIVGIAALPDGQGYWLASADGQVYAFGAAKLYGSIPSVLGPNVKLNAPIVGIAATPSGQGYWLVGADGGIFTFGDARFLGSVPGVLGALSLHLAAPIVGMAADPSGQGYWVVGADGGIFTFGSAPFLGSVPGVLGPSASLNAPVVGMASTPGGHGYWLVAQDGGIFTFGSAPFLGSLGGKLPNDPVAGMAVAPGGKGYWLVEPDGFDYAFERFGRLPVLTSSSAVARTDAQGGPQVARSVTTSASTAPESSGTTTGSAGFSGEALRQRIVEIAESQVAPAADPGTWCNPYGPCVEWCSLFATWVWDQSGIPIPSYAFVGDTSNWAVRHGVFLPPSATPAPGDFLFYGTGPATPATAVHMGVVADVWPDGAISTVEGDAGPGPGGYLGVVVNGPFFPWQSTSYNGFPIYGYATPPGA